MAKHTSRADALSAFKAAQKMLSEGEAELESAHAKIKLARELLVKSTDVIRSTSISQLTSRQSEK